MFEGFDPKRPEGPTGGGVQPCCRPLLKTPRFRHLVTGHHPLVIACLNKSQRGDLRPFSLWLWCIASTIATTLIGRVPRGSPPSSLDTDDYGFSRPDAETFLSICVHVCICIARWIEEPVFVHSPASVANHLNNLSFRLWDFALGTKPQSCIVLF